MKVMQQNLLKATSFVINKVYKLTLSFGFRLEGMDSVERVGCPCVIAQLQAGLNFCIWRWCEAGVEQATLLGHIPRNDRANGPLDGTELSSHVCIGGVRYIYASFLESFWHQEVLFCLMMSLI
jgi:hypothetical protein